MTNLDFLKQINAIIVNIDSKYYAYIPNIISGYANNGYYKGIYVLLDNEFLNNDNLESYVVNFDINTDDEENIYYSTSLKPDSDKILQDINDDIILENTHDYLYYSILNNITLLFSDDEVNNAYQTFAIILQDYAYVTDISLLTQIYKKVIEFYANGKTDSTLVDLRLILESNSYNYLSTSKYSECGCNSSNSTSTISSLSTNMTCAESYLQAIQMYMVQMFADLNFYYNFFFSDTDEPNDEMIDDLIALLEAVLDKLSAYQQIGSATVRKHCKCPDEDTIDKQTYNIILNYIKVLNWVKNCEIEENTNKIQVYGKEFGELFPNLYF